MTQKQMVLDYMRRNGSITGWLAVTELGVMKLSNRIGELESDGYEIERKDEKAVNRVGKKTHYTRYSLKE